MSNNRALTISSYQSGPSCCISSAKVLGDRIPERCLSQSLSYLVQQLEDIRCVIQDRYLCNGMEGIILSVFYPDSSSRIPCTYHPSPHKTDHIREICKSSRKSTSGWCLSQHSSPLVLEHKDNQHGSSGIDWVQIIESLFIPIFFHLHAYNLLPVQQTSTLDSGYITYRMRRS